MKFNSKISFPIPAFASRQLQNSAAATMMVAAMMVAAPLAAPAGSPLANRAMADEKPRPGMIRVTGEGEVALAPDMAIIALGVVREAKTAREALTANNEAMADVINAMKAEGIADKDLQTSGFNIAPRYYYPPRKNNSEEQKPPQIVGYVVSNNVSVRIRDLSSVGAVLDKVVTLGVNSGGNIQFTNDNPKEALNAARKAAVEDAIAKATLLTGTAGVALGRITDISENTNTPRPVPMAQGRMMAEAASADSVPIQGGENTYKVHVSIAWEIDQ